VGGGRSVGNSSEIRLAAYAAKGRKRVKGWLARIDAEIIKTILTTQNKLSLGGGVAEIGVHHGKCFIELCLGLNKGEMGYCVDIFEQQNLNKDRSGHGDRTRLEANLRAFEIDLKSIVVDSRSSEIVKAEDILGKAGPIRAFSVDGGHWLEIVQNDLGLAEQSISPHGVIILDDFHRPEWPDVSMGYFSWNSAKSKPIIPFAIGFNKLYLSEQGWAETYSKALFSNGFLGHFLNKHSEFGGHSVPVYQRYIIPEMKSLRLARTLMMTLAPGPYARLMALIPHKTRSS
jgi:hypothetical protein